MGIKLAAVSIMTSGAGGSDFNDMLAVVGEALIPQNTFPGMTFIAKSIMLGAFR